MQFNPKVKHSYYNLELKECVLTQQPCWKRGFDCDRCNVVIFYNVKPELRNAVVTEEFLQQIDEAQKREEAEMNELIAARNKPFKKVGLLEKILRLFKI